MDKVEGKGGNDNQHSHREQLHCGVFLKLCVTVGQHKVSHLYDV